MRIPRIATPSLLLITVAGCAAGGGPETRAKSTAGPADIASQEELRRSGERMLGPALQRLHPGWMRSTRVRTASAPRGEAPLVYYGSVPVERDVLWSLPLADVDHVRYLSPMEATIRYGTGHPGGALLVQPRQGGSR